jgi:hypothetical protein
MKYQESLNKNLFVAQINAEIVADLLPKTVKASSEEELIPFVNISSFMERVLKQMQFVYLMNCKKEIKKWIVDCEF